MVPEVGVGGAPDIGTPLLEANEVKGEDVEVAEADTEVPDSGRSDDRVVGKVNGVDGPLPLCCEA